MDDPRLSTHDRNGAADRLEPNSEGCPPPMCKRRAELRANMQIGKGGDSATRNPGTSQGGPRVANWIAANVGCGKERRGKKKKSRRYEKDEWIMWLARRTVHPGLGLEGLNGGFGE